MSENSVSENIVFTIFTKNYLAYARTLADSLNNTNKSISYVAILLDDPQEHFNPAEETFEIILGSKLLLDAVGAVKLFTSSPLEACCLAKPLFAKYLLETRAVSKLLYLDSDIVVLDFLGPLFEYLDCHDILLFPQTLTPCPESKEFLDRNLIRTGIFNAGMFAVSSRSLALKFLNWWFTRCLQDCSRTSSSSGYLDQKWLNLVPIFFETTLICRGREHNVAAWNLCERTVSKLQERYLCQDLPIVTWHMSIPEGCIDRVFNYPMSKEQDHQIIRTVYDSYKSNLFAHGYAHNKDYPYSFNYYVDGKQIGQFERFFVRHLGEHAIRDPSLFERKGFSYLGWCTWLCFQYLKVLLRRFLQKYYII